MMTSTTIVFKVEPRAVFPQLPFILGGLVRGVLGPMINTNTWDLEAIGSFPGGIFFFKFVFFCVLMFALGC